MGKKVLIVNYEPKRLSRLNQLIVDLGYESVTAKNGTEALEAVDNFVPDLAIIDPMLPKLSGFEVAQRLTSDHPKLPIIMVTSVYKGNRYRTEAITKYGVKEYLEEPFEDETLQTLVKKYLELSEPPKMQKKKASARRRLEEILEETMSGKVPGAKAVSHKPKASNEPALTSSDIFSDVIKDVEEAPGDMAAVAEKEKAKAEAEAKAQEKQVVEKEAVAEASLKEQEAPAEPKEESRPEPKPEAKTKPESKPAEEPAVKKREVEVKSETPEPKKGQAEEKGKKKGKKSEGIEYGSYVLLEKVATGGMAELFKAKRRGVQGFQKIVAIKRILSHLVDNEEFVTMFIDEAKLAAQLNHPNIAQIYDLGKIENSFYIAMEYVEGYDLRNILKECKKKNIRIPEPLVLFIASKMLSALDYAHRKKGLDMKDLKIVHRDISPQNILISKGGDVKLVDFGIAKAATKASQTQAGALKGKLLYMSPEQAYGKPIDNRSDLFSLASVIYESITGKKCFLADSEISILEKVRKVKYTPIREVNPDVSSGTEDLIRQAFSKNIEDRFQSAKEMESELHTLMESLPFAINERILAQFVNALYQGDLKTIEDISKRYTIKEDAVPENVEAPVEEEPVEQKPEPVVAVSMDDLDENVDANETVKMDSGTMIMPDLEDVEKHEDEMLEQFGGGSSGNKTGLIVAVVVVAIILAVVGYFAWMRKASPAQQVKKETSQSTVTKPETTTPETNTAATEQPGTVTQPEEQKVEAQKAVTPADLGIDKEKLVQQLVQKKLAEADAKQKKVKKEKKPVAKPTPKPVQEKPVVVEKKTVAESPAVAEPVKSETNTATTTPAETKATDLTTTPTTEPETKEFPVVNEPANSTTAETKPAESETTIEKPAPKPVEAKPIPQPIIPKVKEGDLVPLIKGEVIFPTPVKTVRARISVVDRRRNLHGEVLVQGLIDENGNVVPEEVRVLTNSVKVRNNLGKSAISAFKKWKFTPAMKDGVKVKVYFTHMFVF